MAAKSNSADEPESATADQFHPADVGVPGPLRVACYVLGLECAAFVVLAAFLVFDTITGDPASIGRALLGAAFALAGAAALGAGARGLLRLSAAARTPIVVIQLLALPVSYSLAFQAGLVVYGGPILVAALTVLYLLFTPPARAALDRDIQR